MSFLRRFSPFFLFLICLFTLPSMAWADIPTVVRSNVKVLPTASAAASPNAVSSGSVQVENLAPNLMNLSGSVPSIQVGDVLISKEGRGSATKVLSVVTGGGSTTVRTEQASLLDIFEEADIKTSQQLGPSNFSSVQTMLPGVTYKGATTPTANLRDDIQAARYDLPGLGFQFDRTKIIGTGGSLNVNGSISVQPSVDLDVEIRKLPFPKLTKCNYVSRFETTTQLTVSAKEDITFVDKKFLYAVLQGTPIVFSVGPIPVVITPVMGLYFQVNANAKAGLIFTAQDYMSIEGGLNWEDGKGITPVRNFEHRVGYTFDAYAKMKLEVTPVRPELKCYIYSLEGPYIYLNAPKITTNVELLPDKLKWTIHGSVDGGAAFKSEILGVKIDLNTPVTITNQLLADGEIPLGRTVPTPAPEPTSVPVPIASLQVTPSSDSVYSGSYKQFSARLIDTNGYPVNLSADRLTWTSSNANVATINASGAARGIAPGSVTITATDTISGKSGTASLSVGYGPNVVTNTHVDGLGSLREAIDYANVFPNTTISFRIPKSDPNYQNGQFTIADTYMAPLRQDTTLDGTTQTAFTGDTNPNGPEVNAGNIKVDGSTINFKGGVFNYVGDTNADSNSTLVADSTAILNWISGSLSGTLNIPSGVVLTLPVSVAGGRHVMDNGVLNNAGKVEMQVATAPTSTSVGMIGKGRINNSGTWTMRNGSGVYSYSTSLFTNSGTLVAIGSDSKIVECPLNNTGTIDVQGGTLSSYLGQHKGTLNTASGATLALNGVTLETGTTINGAGTTVVAANPTASILNGTVTVNGTMEISSLQGNTSGTLVGPGTVKWTGDVSGTLNLAAGAQSQVPAVNWISGSLSGTLNIPSGGVLTLPVNVDGNRYVIDSGVLNNAGKVEMQVTTEAASSSFRMIGKGRINNSGTWTMRNGSAVYSYSTSLFTNSGTLVAIGSESKTVECPLYNTGTIDVQGGTLSLSLYGSTQDSGSTLLNGGSLGGTLNLKGGVLAGSGNVGTIINSGAIVLPGNTTIGTINVNGDYTQSGTGALELQLGGTTSDKFDRLLVRGTTTLGGNVNVAYANGFVPAVGDKFAVVTHQERSGQFAKVIAPTVSGGRSFNAVYNANDVTLQTVDANPNRAPVLTDASFDATKGVAFSKQLAGTDADNDALTFKVTIGALPAGLNLSASGLIAGTPTQVESKVVTVEVSDGKGGKGTAQITIVVKAAVVPPTLNPSLTPVSPKTNETLTVAPNGDAASYAYVWKKNGNVLAGETAATLNLLKAGNGDKNDVITCEVTAKSASGATATATAQVTVVNSTPIAISSQGFVDHGVEKGFVLNAYDADGDKLTYKRVGGPVNGVLADIRVDPTDGKIKLFYKSRVRYGGVDIIRFVVFDSDNKQSNESTLGISVLYTPPPPVNRAPFAGNTFIDTYVNTTFIKGLLGSDPDGDPVTFRLVNNALYGKSEIKQDKDGLFKLFYTSLNRFYGNDRVTYIAVDKYGKESNLATVGINFINRSPVAQGNRIGVATGAEVSQYLFGTDEDGDALTYRLVNNPRYGKGEVKRDGQGLWRFFYQSLPGYVGPDQITFIAIDPMGKESSVAAIDINVIRVGGSAPSAVKSGTAPSGGNS